MLNPLSHVGFRWPLLPHLQSSTASWSFHHKQRWSPMLIKYKMQWMVPLAALMEAERDVISKEDATMGMLFIVSGLKMPPSLVHKQVSDISFQVHEIGKRLGYYFVLFMQIPKPSLHEASQWSCVQRCLRPAFRMHKLHCSGVWQNVCRMGMGVELRESFTSGSADIFIVFEVLYNAGAKHRNVRLGREYCYVTF